MSSRARPIVLLLATVILASSCGKGSSAIPPTTSSPSVSPSSSSTPSPSPSPTPSCAQQVFDSMSEAQRIGQLFVMGLADDQLGSDERDAIRTRHIGSVSFIVTTTEGVTGVRAVTDAVQALATQANTARVRFFVAANQEGGQIQALRGSGYSTMPTAVVQGGFDPKLLQADATTWGRQLLSAGVNFNFAPVADVVPPGHGGLRRLDRGLCLGLWLEWRSSSRLPFPSLSDLPSLTGVDTGRVRILPDARAQVLRS